MNFYGKCFAVVSMLAMMLPAGLNIARPGQHDAPASANGFPTPRVLHLGDQDFSVQIVSPTTEYMDKFGPRFDLTGAVSSITYKGKPFLGIWGLVDEFNIVMPPPGYTEAQPGETFMKIGVGELVKDSNRPYQFSHQYAFRQMAVVSVAEQPDSVQLTQAVKTASGWGYELSKTYRVSVSEASLRIEYVLKNTGTQTIHTEQYNHNWFALNGAQPGPAYFLETKFPLTGNADWLDREGTRLVPLRPVAKSTYYPSAEGGTSADNRLVLGNPAEGMSVEIGGDFDPARFALYAEPTAICPEVFVEFQLHPGESRKWSRSYQFKVNEPRVGTPAH